MTRFGKRRHERSPGPFVGEGAAKEVEMGMMPGLEPTRRRSARHLCAACRERKARFQYRGEVRADRQHVLCFQCFRAERERLRAWQFRETYGPVHRALRPGDIEHRRRMLEYLETQVSQEGHERRQLSELRV